MAVPWPQDRMAALFEDLRERVAGVLEAEPPALATTAAGIGRWDVS